jgi:ribosomal protein S18 acetylase RimI-like enzyme
MSQRGQLLGEAIRSGTSADVGAMAHIHARSGTPGPLSDLGEGFLRDVYYGGLLASPNGQALVLEVAGNVVGFVTFSLDSNRLFGEIFRHRMATTMLALARASLRKPRVAVDFAQSVLAVEGSGAGSDVPAEVVSLEIAPAFQGLGLGFILLQRGLKELRAAGAERVKARIVEDHRAVERIYLNLGFRRGKPFRLHGRQWVVMVLDDAS